MKRALRVRAPLVALGLVAGLLLSTAAEATGPYYKSSVPARMGRKFVRGLGNVTFGFVEIPKSINEEVQMLDPFAGTFTGLCKGTGRFVKRTVVGAFEIATFPIETTRDYRPIIRPEFVMLEDMTSWRDRVEDME